MCVCLIDEEAHGVFGSCRRGRGATIEATCRKATGENADRRAEGGDIVETTSSVLPESDGMTRH